MNSVTLIHKQQEAVQEVAREVIAVIPDHLWTASAYAGAPPLGFIAWHIAATRDWALQTWIRGLPEVRTQPEFASVNLPFPPFGMPADDALAVARAASASGVIVYLDAVHLDMSGWLDTLTDADLERVADTRTHGTRLPIHQAPGYPAEVNDMYDLAAWQVLSGACYGHIRGHIGEIETSIAVLRAR